MVRKYEEMRTDMRANLREGNGEIGTRYLMEKDDMQGKCQLFSILTLEPGTSIGLHMHKPDAELFFVLQGELETSDNGVVKTLALGDSMFTGSGESHYLINKSKETARVLAVIIP